MRRFINIYLFSFSKLFPVNICLGIPIIRVYVVKHTLCMELECQYGFVLYRSAYNILKHLFNITNRYALLSFSPINN